MSSDRSRSHRATRALRRWTIAVRLFLFSAICSPKLAQSSMAQIPSARAPVINLLPKGHHFPEPVVTGARGKSERVARFPNCFAFDKHEAVEFWFLRLGRMVDATPEAAVDDEASFAFRVHATPSSGAGTISSAALCLPPAKYARRIAYCSSHAIPREEKVEQRVQEMFLALSQVARPYDQSALRVGGRYRELPGALVSPVKAMDERTGHVGVEFKIEVAHGGSSVLTRQRSRVRPPQNEMFEFLDSGQRLRRRDARQLVIRPGTSVLPNRDRCRCPPREF